MTVAASPARVAVVGASSQIGPALIRRLAAAGHPVARISRERPQPPAADHTWHVYDARRREFEPVLAGADVVISLAPLPHVDTVIDMASQLQAHRVLAFGSSSVLTKADSTAGAERLFVQEQRAAEARLQSRSARAGIDWTLFRPTMIYGAGADLNVEFIRTLVRRLRGFPIPAGADGLRQPVHVDDLAAACVAALTCPSSRNRAYDLGGGEVLGYRAMVRRIAAADGTPCVLLPVPHRLYRTLVTALARRPRFAHLRAEMVDRMFENLIVDHTPAQSDFGYRPRCFSPRPPGGG